MAKGKIEFKDLEKMSVKSINALGDEAKEHINQTRCIVFYDKSYVVPPHTHNCFEMTYILSGKGTDIVNDETKEIKKGDCFIINPGSVHQDSLKKSNGVDGASKITCAFFPDFISPSFKNLNNLKDLMEGFGVFISTDSQSGDNSFPSLDIHTNCFHDDDGLTKQLFIQCLNEFLSPGAGSETIIRNNIVNILILLLRNNMMLTSNPPSDDPFTIICEYMKSNYMQKITLEDVSKIAGYSPQYISKQFPEITGGDNFKTALKKIRIDNACRLLLTTNRTIAEIVGLVGYKDIKTFNAAFKQITGMTPYQFKKAKKKKQTLKVDYNDFENFDN